MSASTFFRICADAFRFLEHDHKFQHARSHDGPTVARLEFIRPDTTMAFVVVYERLDNYLMAYFAPLRGDAAEPYSARWVNVEELLRVRAPEWVYEQPRLGGELSDEELERSCARLATAVRTYAADFLSGWPRDAARRR